MPTTRPYSIGLDCLHIATNFLPHFSCRGLPTKPYALNTDKQTIYLVKYLINCTRFVYCIPYWEESIYSPQEASMRGSLYPLSHIIRYPVIPAREQNTNVSQAFTLVHYQYTGVTTCFGVYLPMESWWSSSVALLEALHMRCQRTRIAPMEW